MRKLVESLRRLYRAGKVSDETLREMVSGGTITESEYDYIVG